MQKPKLKTVFLILILIYWWLIGIIRALKTEYL